MFRYLLAKEFKQFKRNEFLPRLVVMFPIMTMLIMPWVATLDIKNINVSVVDEDNTVTSRRLIEKIGSTQYFEIKERAITYGEALESMRFGDSDLIVNIPYCFEKDIVTGQGSNVFIAANAVNGTKGSMGSGYISQILESFSREILPEPASKNSDAVNISVISKYNPTLDYKKFMIPALMSIVVLMICGFLPALNIVSEKEIGTIEQINATPVKKWQFILAKLLPYWIIGLFVLSICFLISWIVYGFFPAGNFITLYTITLAFIFAMSGLGILISNFSQTMQQAMLVMFFFMLVFNLMSGLFTPVSSMPEWAQWIAAFIPPKYFIEAMRGIYQMGVGFRDLIPQFIILLCFGFCFNLLAIVTYRKRS